MSTLIPFVLPFHNVSNAFLSFPFFSFLFLLSLFELYWIVREGWTSKSKSQTFEIDEGEHRCSFNSTLEIKWSVPRDIIIVIYIERVNEPRNEAGVSILQSNRLELSRDRELARPRN